MRVRSEIFKFTPNRHVQNLRRSRSAGLYHDLRCVRETRATHPGHPEFEAR